MPGTAGPELKASPDHKDWIYTVGEPVTFEISVTHDNMPLDGAEIYWSIGPEKMEPFKTGITVTKQGKAILECHGMDRPGFLRCWARASVNGEKLQTHTTAAYDPYEIEPTTTLPDDFMDYWKPKIEAQKRVPLNAVFEKQEDQCTPRVDVYHISYSCGTEDRKEYTSKFYGMLAVPKGKGPYPALLQVPGAGIRPYKANTYWAEHGVIHLTVGIHGIPVNLPENVYNNLYGGALSAYWRSNLDRKDDYYYHRVFLGCVRAVEFLAQYEKYDGKTMGIEGGSQGGALSIITAALEPRILFCSSAFPAMCDHTGYLYNRAGGWPHLFEKNYIYDCTLQNIENSKYYDVVNFARFLNIPLLMGLGFNDTVCPPTSMFSAFNVINSPKKMSIHKEYGHEYIPEFESISRNWLAEKLSGHGSDVSQ